MESFDLCKNYEFEGFWWVEGESLKFPGKLRRRVQFIFSPI